MADNTTLIPAAELAAKNKAQFPNESSEYRTARNALLSNLQVGAPIDTVAGTYTFGPVGDQLDPQIYFYTLRDGKFAYLRQAHPSSFMVK